MSSKDESEFENELIGDVCDYVSNKTYPAGANKNRKRIIRRKAKKVVVRHGVVYYKKRKERFVIYVLDS